MEAQEEEINHLRLFLGAQQGHTHGIPALGCTCSPPPGSSLSIREGFVVTCGSFPPWLPSPT